MRYYPISSIPLSCKQLPFQQAQRGNFRCRQEPAVLTRSEAKRIDFQSMFVAKCQFRIEKGKHNTSNGVSSHVPSLSVMLYLTKG